MNPLVPHSWRERWAWAFYDWANSVFITTVVVALFPIFFRNYWAKDLPSEQVTFYLGNANSLASLTITILAPFLGAIADRSGKKKGLLASFLLLGVVATFALATLGENQWQFALFAFALGMIGFLGGNIFYDSLLVDVAAEPAFNRVSALGYSLGYLGGGLFLILSILLSLHPEWFGLADKATGVKVAFALTALWWAIFSIPLFLYVREHKVASDKLPFFALLKSAVVDFIATFREIRQHRTVALFLLAYWFYIDGVDTIVVMAVDYGQSLGLPADSLITALLVTQFTAFPAALLFGWIGTKYSAKNGILIAIVGYALITIGASQMETVRGFYGLAFSVGLFQGGIQALSRSYFASLIPADEAAKFFGFYNMLGKFAAVLGPALVGWVGLWTGSSRIGLLALLILFVLGGLILWRVPKSN
ncbi:MFS transporter [Thiofilum flexile]|uniref:MFS transporter n=1 Tax=Thiofilum flexile TaxID=125627 RepID=UPI0003745BD3|nr:MFS transporter [Thiofilum flexile]